MSTYNGWTNYHTWNVALWIANDEGLHNEARHFASAHMNQETATYKDFIDDIMPEFFGFLSHITPDGVSWTDPMLDHDQLDGFIRGLSE